MRELERAKNLLEDIQFSLLEEDGELSVCPKDVKTINWLIEQAGELQRIQTAEKIKRYKVYIQVNDDWELLATYGAKSIQEAERIAREDKQLLLEHYKEEELPYVNVEAEEIV